MYLSSPPGKRVSGQLPTERFGQFCLACNTTISDSHWNGNYQDL